MPARGDMVPIISSFHEERKDIALGPIALSIRQLLTVLVAGALWYVLGFEVIGGIIGSPIIGGLFLIFIPYGALKIAFVRVEDLPYEYHLANKVIRMTDGDMYVLKQRREAQLSSLDWYYDVNGDKG